MGEYRISGGWRKLSDVPAGNRSGIAVYRENRK